MTPLQECTHEREVLDLVLADRWPERTHADIIAHVAECAVCTDVVNVALAMQQAEPEVSEAALPDATLVWWRSQLRAHEEAGRQAARPIAMVQGVAVGIGLVGALSITRAYWSVISSATANYTATATSWMSGWHFSALSTPGSIAPWIALAGIAALIATPVAVYLALGRE